MGAQECWEKHREERTHREAATTVDRARCQNRRRAHSTEHLAAILLEPRLMPTKSTPPWREYRGVGAAP
jgi:hypothetical protein